jgi:NADH-quinone oxidoreductase subunit L
MLLLVMGSNFVVLFFGWEGVGLCSYGLIGFWYSDVEKAKAAMKAFVVNRFGDFGFIIGLFLLFWSLSGAWPHDTYTPERGLAGVVKGVSPEQPKIARSGEMSVQLGPTVEFRELRNQIADESTGMAERLRGMTLWGLPILALIGIFMFIGATGKSAQIPLYVWLPDAMAGPTPVSALIHAATMVTAGVYMVARLNFIFALSPHAMTVVAVIGALTAIFAASIGFFQYDIKKVLAYSTVSQLGFMFIGVGVGAYWAGIYHLMTHAFFKATLFLGSGSVIMACHHEQDMRKMGGLKKYTPITRWTYLIACWAIAGFPIASGFYSKDEILWKAWTAQGLITPWLGQVIYAVGAVAALGTSFYMFRSYYMTFTGDYRGNTGDAHGHGHDDAHGHGHDDAAAHGADAAPHGGDDHGHHGGEPHESPKSMTWVLMILAAAAVLASLLGLPQAWTGRAPLLEHWLEPSLTAQEGVPFAPASHSTELLFQAIGVGIAFAGWLTAKWLYDGNKSTIPARLKAIFHVEWEVVYDKYYIDEIYQATIVRGSLWLSQAAYWFDQNVIDGVVNGIGWLGRAVAYIDAAIDKYLVDGAVNALADATMESGRTLRRAQTGQINAYLFGALGGALVFVIVQYVIR